MRSAALLIPLVLLAGCTQLEDARQGADDAREALVQAQREAQEARDRFERVRSAAVVREEVARVVVVAMGNETAIWFDAAAFRGAVPIPRENLTALPHVRVTTGAFSFTCDPLSCTLAKPDADVNVTWADGAAGSMLLPAGNAGCESGTSGCRVGELVRERGTVKATTAAGDVTD